MIKDTKYIIKRILIGVGIILVLSFIRGNKVKALTSFEMYNGQVAPTFPTYCDNKKTLLYTDSYFLNLQPPNFIFDYKSVSGRSLVLLCIDTNNSDFIYSTDKFNQYSVSFSNFKRFYYQNQRWNEFSNSQYISGPTNGISYNLNSSTTCPFKDTLGCLIWYNNSYNYFITKGTIMYTDFDIVKEGSKLYFDRATAPIFKPSIESLQPTKITNNNVITGYIFRPKFTNFNIDNFDYQYKVGKDSTRWLSLTSNEQQIKINNNTILYVRIKDKNTNEVIDSQTFTITNISKFDTEQDYNITFSGEYRTENYLNNNISSKSQSLIKEYQIYVDYTPKTSILRYQYQYVKDGDSLDNNWQNVASSDNGSFTYVATENGTLYARILDSSDNNLYSATFTVNNIGLLAFDSNEKGLNNFFTKLSSKINYGGPVSSLFVIPVNTLNFLYSSMSNSSSCSPIQLGSLLGTSMQFGCYDFKSIVGNEVYNIIDIIFAFVLTIGVFKFILKLYNNFISMKEV